MNINRIDILSLQEHFEGTLTRIPESYHVEARALFAEQEKILDDVTNLNDLTDGERAEYDDVKDDLKDLFDEVKYLNMRT